MDRLRRDLHEAHAEGVWFGAYIAESPVRHRLFRGDLDSEETAANNELLADAMRSVTALVSGSVQLGGVNTCQCGLGNINICGRGGGTRCEN